MRTKYLAVALAVGMPLAAVGYLVWAFYSTLAGYERTEPPPPPHPDAVLRDQWYAADPTDPADPVVLYSKWTSRAESDGGANLRESTLDIRQDGTLVWATRVTIKTLPTIEHVEYYKFSFLPGRFLQMTQTGHAIDGKEVKLRDDSFMPKTMKLVWLSDDKSSFQLQTDPRDKGRPHLLFRKAPPEGEKKG